MTRKHYQWLALAILILGPLLTSILSDYLPGRERDNPIELGAPVAAPSVEPVAVIRTDMPPAQAATTQQNAPMASDGAALDVNPTLDTSGMAVSGADVGLSAAMAPDQPVVSAITPALNLPASAPPPAGRTPPFREGPVNR